MKIIAIDPGYDRVGIAVLEKAALSGSREKVLFSECFTTSKTQSFYVRLCALGARLEGLIDLYQPEALAIETLFFNTNKKTAMQVAEARGATLYIAVSHGLAIYEYSPLQIKIATTGYGRATKEQVIFMTQKILGLEKVKKIVDDEYDALAIGITHIASYRKPQ